MSVNSAYTCQNKLQLIQKTLTVVRPVEALILNDMGESEEQGKLIKHTFISKVRKYARANHAEDCAAL